MTRRTLLIGGLFLFAYCTRHEPLCPNWELQRKETLPESGSRQLRLIRKTAAVEVDRLVFSPRCYPNDCVIYGTDRGGDESFYTACGEHQPVRLSVTRTEADKWSLTSEGYETAGEPFLRGDRLYRQREIFRISDVAAAAARQPPVRPEWWSGNIETVHPTQEILPFDAKSESGRKMLLRAIDGSDERVAVALLKAGADIEPQDEFGRKPVVLAAEKGLTNVVEALLDAGASSSNRDIRGDDILMIAVNRHDVNMVKALYARRRKLRVDPNRALNVAISLGQQDTVPILRDWSGPRPEVHSRTR